MKGLVRSFVAVETTETVRTELRQLLERMKSVTPCPVKWVRPDQAHLTLAFLGEVSEEFLARAEERLAEVAAKFGPLACRLAGCGAFPNQRRARVVWAGMSDGADELRRLQGSVSGALARVGYQPERGAYAPHLTLGRLREPADVSAMAATQFQSSPFGVDRILLFRSQLRPEGPVYSILAAFPLRQ